MFRRGVVTILACFCFAAAFYPGVAEAARGRGKAVKQRAERRTRRAPDPEPRAAPVAPAVAAPAPAPTGAPPPSRGPTRIDFDDRLVTGQTNKSGSVYLYDRKELKTASMLKMRESFREEIVGSVYDTGK